MPSAAQSRPTSSPMPPAPTTHAVLPSNQQRPICAVVERARVAIDGGAVEALGEMQNAGHRVFRHRQRIARTSRGRHGHIAAPQIAPEQIAGARRALMKPFELRRPGAQIERKRPAAEDYFRVGKEAIAFLAGSRARGTRRQIARRTEGRPGFAIFAVKPARRRRSNRTAGSTASIFARSSALMRWRFRTLQLCMGAFPDHSRKTPRS